jgi:hypothetical protein
MRTTILLLGSFSIVLAGAACGGNVVIDLPPVGSGAGGAGGSSSTSTQTGPGTTTVTTGPTTVTGVGAGPGTSTSVTTGTTTGTGPATTSSSSSGGPPVQVSCNGAPCAPGEVCCFNPTAPGDHCGQSGQCGSGFVELTCNSPDDCPGNICCAKLGFDPNGVSLQGTSCQPSCSGMDELIVCTQMTANICPMGTGCHHDPDLGVGNGYRFCVP